MRSGAEDPLRPSEFSELWNSARAPAAADSENSHDPVPPGKLWSLRRIFGTIWHTAREFRGTAANRQEHPRY
jgi:hypothetical protein